MYWQRSELQIISKIMDFLSVCHVETKHHVILQNITSLSHSCMCACAILVTIQSYKLNKVKYVV